MTRLRTTILAALLVLGPAGGWAHIDLQPAAPTLQEQPHPEIAWFLAAVRTNGSEADRALKSIGDRWRDSYAAMIVDLARLLRPAARATVEEAPFPGADEETLDPARVSGDFAAAARPTPPGARTRARLLSFLERQTGQRFGEDLARWRAWMWQSPYDPHPDYAAFKARVYAGIDPRMASFFPPGAPATIRLDEIDWGGVTVNGIPPLDHPKVVRAADAQFLKDSHVVFATVVNGEARAYPKRILAWHEMALDRIGGVEMTVVYCTLCGTAIPYESVIGGRQLTFGTSGLLYRSNKLMFDHETKSLWSTLEGRPVVGALAGSGLELKPHWMVTTTWGEWRAEHSETSVLSLDTGFERDYSEGAAYREYFATDRLMFSVPAIDKRLKNKAEVLVFRLPQPVAIAAAFLERNRLFQTTIADVPLVIVTTPKGANRAYRARDVRFVSVSPEGTLIDVDGRRWTRDEQALVSAGGGDRLARIPASRAFWFGWHAQYPDTILVK